MVNRGPVQHDPLRHNFFRFAPRELSHSAVWAWMFQSLDAGGDPTLRGPRLAVTRLLTRHGIPPLVAPVNVETERWINKRDRLDIRVTDAVGTVIVVENKVLSIPSADQINRYGSACQDNAQTHVLLLSTAFDDDVRGSLDCKYVGLTELLAALRPYRQSHFVLGEYVTWLAALGRRRRRIERDALSDDPRRHSSGLEDAAGQWALMKALTLRLKGRQYRDVGLGGNPWTQFSFVPQTPEHDALFYRIDRCSEGYQFRLRQYRNDVASRAVLEAKRARLRMLRAWWKAVARSHGAGLHLTPPGDRGAKESDVARFLFAKNAPSLLAKRLPALHRAFLGKLKRGGWPTDLYHHAAIDGPLKQ